MTLNPPFFSDLILHLISQLLYLHIPEKLWGMDGFSQSTTLPLLPLHLHIPFLLHHGSTTGYRPSGINCSMSWRSRQTTYSCMGSCPRAAAFFRPQLPSTAWAPVPRSGGVCDPHHRLQVESLCISAGQAPSPHLSSDNGIYKIISYTFFSLSQLLGSIFFFIFS